MSGRNAFNANNLERKIFKCTRSGNIKDFEALLKESSDNLLKWRHPKSGESCLLLSARYGHVDFLRKLVKEHQQSLEEKNNDGKRALHEAALGKHLECVKYLISKNVEIDSLKRADWTPLMLACTKDSLEVVIELLSAGANPKLVNKDGWNSFHIAAREGHTMIIQTLLNVCPDIWNTVSYNGRTPLHTAALHGNLETVLLLLDRASYIPDQADSCGSTPLMDSLRGNHIDIASALINKHHASLEARDKLGRQGVHVAAQTGSLLSLKFLVDDEKLDVQNVVDHSGMLALHIASKGGHTEAAAFLIQAGCKINHQDNCGRTALHLASAAGHHETVALLLAIPGSDVTVTDINGSTPEDFALKREVKELFAKYGENLKSSEK